MEKRLAKDTEKFLALWKMVGYGRVEINIKV